MLINHKVLLIQKVVLNLSRQLSFSIMVKIFKEHLTFLAYMTLSIGTFIHFKKNGLGNDFYVFYQAGSLVSDGNSPYGWSSDPTSNAFLYGPLNALQGSLISEIDYSLALSFFYLCLLVSIPISVSLVQKILSPQSPCDQKIWLLSSIILLSFPIRAAFLYGQLVPIYFAIFVFATWLIRKPSGFNYVLGGCLIGICIDYKPHLFSIMSLIFLQKGIRFYFGVIVITLYPLVAFSEGAQIYSQWLNAIKSRSKTGLDGFDLVGVYSFFLQTKLPIWLFFLLTAFVFLLTLLIILKTALGFYDKWLYITLLILVFSPFTHAQDLLPLVFILVFRAKIFDSFINSFTIGLTLVWSSSWQTNLTLVLAIFALFIITKDSNSSLVCLLGIFTPIIFIQIVDFVDRKATIYFIHFSIFLIYFCILFIYFHFLRSFRYRDTNLVKALYVNRF